MVEAPECDLLVEAAADAGRVWANIGLEARLRVLHQAGARLAESRPQLHEGLFADGLSKKLADYYVEWIVRSSRPELLERYASDHGRWVSTGAGGELMFRRPDGVVLLVVPANSPTLNAATLFSMLLPGNAVICRAPSNDKGLRFIAEEVIGGAMEDHGLPPGVISVVTSRSRVFLDRFIEAPDVRTVVFFGNSRAGRSVSDRGHALDKKVVLELEGSDNMLVWKDADLAAAIPCALRAFDFSTTPCPIPKHFLVHDDIYDAFVEALLPEMPACSITIEADRIDGNLTPVPDPARYEAALKEITDVGEVLFGGYRMKADGTKDPNGRYAAPTLVALDDAALEGRSLLSFDEEIFYPLVPLVRVRGRDHEIADKMARMVSESSFGLRCSIWAEDPAMIEHFTRQIGHVGLILFNDDHAQTPDYAAPWGGPRRSGGPYGENHLFWMKTSHQQAIGCNRLSEAQRAAVFEALGYTRFLPEVTPPEPDRVSLSVHGGVATITLTRPARHNAIDAATVRQLREHLETISAARDDLYAVVIQGEGKSFCSGGDLAAIRDGDADAARHFMTEATWVFRSLERLPFPVIAKVHGHCLGGGFELALHCDEIVAASDAGFGFPETGVGYVTTAGSVARLTAAVGPMRARRLLLSGERLSGREATGLGVVTASCPPEQLDALLRAHVDSYRDLPRRGVAAMKELLRTVDQEQRTQSWISESEAFEDLARQERDA